MLHTSCQVEHDAEVIVRTSSPCQAWEVTPAELLERLCEVYGVENANQLAAHLPYNPRVVHRWATMTVPNQGGGPNFWHTLDLLERAGLVSLGGRASLSRTQTRRLAEQLAEVADALAAARETLREAQRKAAAG
jgi:hypothetical protein